jgi:hypothetical protein
MMPCTSVVDVTSRPCPAPATAANTLRTAPAVGLTAVTPSEPCNTRWKFASEQWWRELIRRLA